MSIMDAWNALFILLIFFDLFWDKEPALKLKIKLMLEAEVVALLNRTSELDSTPEFSFGQWGSVVLQ